MSRILRLSLLMLVLGVVSASPSWSVEVGDPMPGFAIQTFDGARTSHETFKGKPLLLIFWNTWCPNCVRELPEIERLHEAYGPRGLAILGVNTAMNDSEAKARAYWERSDYKFPGAFDRYFETGQAFRIFSVPTILLIDSRGIVRYKQARLPDDVDKRLDELTIRQ